jgi:signal transduction histidine kinase
MKILAIDDSNVNLLIIQKTVEKYLPEEQFESATNGKEGIAIALSWQPDTILLDLQMPEMDGFDTISFLKQNPATAYIPIIILTAAEVKSKERVKALNLGADAFLQKPISTPELAAHIKVMLRIRKAEEHLRHSQKLEAIGLLAGGVAHDFNNILAVIKGYSTMLMMQAQPDTLQSESLQMIIDATQRAADVTQNLLTFGRKREIVPSKNDLSTLVSNFEKFIKQIVGPAITVTCTHKHPLVPANLDRGMIEQMLMNLAINARDAMPDGGQLTIATETAKLDREQALILALPAGQYVRLTIADTGSGISQEVLPKIFDPFFTTKEIGKGSGLGLSTVHGITQQHLGSISVSSTPGNGTTFTIYLPTTGTM